MMSFLVILFCAFAIEHIYAVEYTFGFGAENTCKNYKIMCPVGKICVLQQFNVPRKMSFPVCIAEWRNPAMTNVCDMAPSPGGCRARFRRWYFNKHSGKCTWFHYGGCRGNRNNFRTRALCENACGTAVITTLADSGKLLTLPPSAGGEANEVLALYAAPTATVLVPMTSQRKPVFIDNQGIKVRRRKHRKRGKKHKRRGRKWWRKQANGNRRYKKHLKRLGGKPRRRKYQALTSNTLTYIPRQDELYKNESAFKHVELVKSRGLSNRRHRHWSQSGPFYRNFRLFSILHKRNEDRKSPKP